MIRSTGISPRVKKTPSRLTSRQLFVNGFVFVSMPASGLMAVDAQLWPRRDPAAIGAVIVAPAALA
jgi:hypothetical protein